MSVVLVVAAVAGGGWCVKVINMYNFSYLRAVCASVSVCAFENRSSRRFPLAPRSQNENCICVYVKLATHNVQPVSRR